MKRFRQHILEATHTQQSVKQLQSKIYPLVKAITDFAVEYAAVVDATGVDIGRTPWPFSAKDADTSFHNMLIKELEHEDV
jgi:hypothetical protein